MNNGTSSKRKLVFDNRSLTLVTTALVASSNFVPGDLGKKVAAGASPDVTMVIAYTFEKCKNIIYIPVLRIYT